MVRQVQLIELIDDVVLKWGKSDAPAGAPVEDLFAGDRTWPHAALPLPAELQEQLPQIGQFERQIRFSRLLFRFVERMPLGSIEVLADRTAVGSFA